MKKWFRILLVGIMITILVMPNIIVLAEGEDPPPADPPPPVPIEAKALDDHECDDVEWHFVINQIDDEVNAPPSILVEWNGISEEVDMGNFTGKVAHYTTYSNLGMSVTSASTLIYGGWGGQFNLSHGPCENGHCPPPVDPPPVDPPPVDPPPEPPPSNPPSPPKDPGIPPRSTGVLNIWSLFDSLWSGLMEIFW